MAKTVQGDTGQRAASRRAPSLAPKAAVLTLKRKREAAGTTRSRKARKPAEVGLHIFKTTSSQIHCIKAALCGIKKAYPSLGINPALLQLGRSVHTSGQFRGHCAFASMLCSSRAGCGTPMATATELDCIRSLRRTAVLYNARSLIQAGTAGLDRQAMVVASATAAGYAPPPEGSALAQLLQDLDKAQATCVGYLAGQLSCRESILLPADSSAQYAGPLELAALADCFSRPLLVLAEQANVSDCGGLYMPQGTGAAPCIAAVITRRQHMYPLLLVSAGLSQEGISAWSFSHVAAVEAAQHTALQIAVGAVSPAHSTLAAALEKVLLHGK